MITNVVIVSGGKYVQSKGILMAQTWKSIESQPDDWGLEPGDIPQAERKARVRDYLEETAGVYQDVGVSGPSVKLTEAAEVADGIGETRVAQAAAYAAASSGRRVSNTSPSTSQKSRKGRPRKAQVLPKQSLAECMSPEAIRRRLPDLPCDHWIYSDAERFASLPQAGGGVDWLNFTIYGDLNERGKDRVHDLKALKLAARRLDVERSMLCSEVGYSYLGGDRNGVVVSGADSREVYVSAMSTGAGHSSQPVMARLEGVTVRYGARDSSDCVDGTRKRRPLAFVEVPGTVFLLLGEAGVMRKVAELLDWLGIEVKSTRPSRIDICADLPNADIKEFVKIINDGDFVTCAVQRVDTHMCAVTKRLTGFSLRSKAILLRVYEKYIETERDETKRALMVANRWGQGVKSAVRVEFQFRLSEIDNREYSSLKALFEGVGELVAWACNQWFRLAVVKDKTHSSRAPLHDVWLRAQHAFGWWACRLNTRGEPPRVEVAPPEKLVAQARGLISSLVARSGWVPKDEDTIYAVLHTFIGGVDLVQCVQKKAAEIRSRGTVHVGGPEVSGELGSVFDERKKWDRNDWAAWGRAEARRAESPPSFSDGVG